MLYPLFERPEGFYYSLALTPDWENRLARQIDLEVFSQSSLDEAELMILHFNQLGYTIREISWYYGIKDRKLRDKLKEIFNRLATGTLESGGVARKKGEC